MTRETYSLACTAPGCRWARVLVCVESEARELALFELEVDFDPATFSVRDLASHEPEVRDWTTPASDERDDDSRGWTRA